MDLITYNWEHPVDEHPHHVQTIETIKITPIMEAGVTGGPPAMFTAIREQLPHCTPHEALIILRQILVDMDDKVPGTGLPAYIAKVDWMLDTLGVDLDSLQTSWVSPEAFTGPPTSGMH